MKYADPMRINYFAKMLSRAIFGPVQSKYEARHVLLQSLAHKLGFRLYNKNLTWLNDHEYLAMWKDYPEWNPIIHERRFNLFNLSKMVRNLPGDIAECGVFHAAGSFIMLSATNGSDKKFFGFDSFEGLSEPGERDRISNETAFKWRKHDLTSDEMVAMKNLDKFANRVSLYRGWIPERFDEVNDRRFCLVHIDVDLYEPTKDALDFFVPRMVPGGMIICDDYGFETCPGARKAMDESAIRLGTIVTHLTTGQGVLMMAGNHG